MLKTMARVLRLRGTPALLRVAKTVGDNRAGKLQCCRWGSWR
jgi:hypothetical protein